MNNGIKNKNFIEYDSIHQNIIEILYNNVCILPTDTIYGIFGLATDTEIIKKIYQIKRRNSKKALTIFPESMEKISDYVILDSLSQKLISQFFPGNLTLVLRKKESEILAKNISPNDFLGIRFPNHPLLQKILMELKQPLVATSVNCSGDPDLNSPVELQKFADQHNVPLFLEKKHKISPPSIVLKIDGNKYEFLRYYPESVSYKKIMKIIKQHQKQE